MFCVHLLHFTLLSAAEFTKVTLEKDLVSLVQKLNQGDLSCHSASLKSVACQFICCFLGGKHGKHLYLFKHLDPYLNVSPPAAEEGGTEKRNKKQLLPWHKYC